MSNKQRSIISIIFNNIPWSYTMYVQVWLHIAYAWSQAANGVSHRHWWQAFDFMRCYDFKPILNEMLLALSKQKQWKMKKYEKIINTIQSTYYLPSLETNSMFYTSIQDKCFQGSMFPAPGFVHRRTAYRSDLESHPNTPWRHSIESPLRFFFVVVRHEWMIQLQHCGMTPKNRLAACCSYNLKEIKTSATQKHTHTHTHIWPDPTIAVAFVSICCSQLSHCWC